MRDRQMTVVQLYEKHRHILIAESRRKLTDPHLVEEACQESILKIVKQIDRISAMAEDEQAKYIRKLARYTAIDVFYREVASKNNVVSMEELNGEEPADVLELDTFFADIKVGPEVDEYIAELEPEYREIICLHYGEGLSYAEIAELLSMKEPAVRKRLSRARLKLKEILLRKEEK